MILTDTHTHIYQDVFAGDIDVLMAKNLEQGVQRLFLPNIDEASYQPMWELVKKWPENIFPMMGLHPCSVTKSVDDQLLFVADALSKDAYVAVGEIGLDLYWDRSLFAEQKKAFERQIDLAIQHHLPIVIHTRDAFDEVFEVLDRKRQTELRGVFHCFSGNQDQMEKALSYEGFYLGIGGVITFKNAGLDKIIKNAPISRLVLETDAPYLAPHPFRGKRNEPAYIIYVAEKLASVFELSLAEVARITTQNSRDLFGI